MRCVICGKKPTKLLKCSICDRTADYICDGYVCQPSLWALKPGEKSVVKLMELKCEHCDHDLILQKLPSTSLLQELPTIARRSPASSLMLMGETPSLLCSSSSRDVVQVGERGIQPPRFRNPIIPPVRRSSVELVEICTKALVRQTATRNYDRVIFINEFLSFFEFMKSKHDEITPIEALKIFELDSCRLLSVAKGGHCGALCGNLMQDLGMGYMCASKLPKTYQQKGAPELCHAGQLIPFENPLDKLDCGLILLEPGFNIVQPIVLKEGQKQIIKCSESEVYSFILVKGEITMLPEPAPTKERDIREKSMTYRVDELLNPDSSITVPLLAVDARPCILSRDERGQLSAKLIVNFAKSQIEISAGSVRSAVKFEDVNKNDDWISPELALLFHTDKPALLARIRQLVKHEKTLQQLREERYKG